jgi:hypothetical protein
MNEDFTKIPDNLPQPNNDGKTNPLLVMIILSIMLSPTKEMMVLSEK